MVYVCERGGGVVPSGFSFVWLCPFFLCVGSLRWRVLPCWGGVIGCARRELRGWLLLGVGVPGRLLV